MATPIAGTGGLLKVSGTPDVTVGEIKEWQLEIDRENYDASTLGTTWRVNVSGIGSWTGSLTGFFSVKTDTGQTLLQNAVLNGTGLYVEFLTANGTYEGAVNPSKIAVANPVDGITTFDMDFQGNGQLFFS
jgi:predicted secreted protein